MVIMKKKMVMMTVTKIVGEGCGGGGTLGQPSSATTTNQSQAVAAVAQTLANTSKSKNTSKSTNTSKH